MKKVLRITSVLFCAALILSGCQKPKEEGDSNNSPDPTGNPTAGEGEFSTDCGVVMNGDLKNPVSLQDGEQVRVKQVLSANLLAVESSTNPGGPVLVKLHGIAGSPDNRNQAAISALSTLSAGTPTFYRASQDCNISLPDGGQGIIGQLISRDGKSFSEELVRRGLATIDPADTCGGDKIAACLEALKGTEIKCKGEMADFLWKPVSDTKGNVVVVHELHCNTQVIVHGETFSYAGAGNGRCGTFVGKKNGCGYGGNIKVEVIDKQSGQPYCRNGQPYVVVPNGCSRHEFK